MKHMTLANIAKACNGQLIGGPSYEKACTENLYDKKVAAGVELDSRLIKKDDLFIATVGERVDGHDFIEDAFKKGALAVVCEKIPKGIDGPYILVKDSLSALKDIARWYRMQLSVKVVGITGSVGKTSTKEFISSVLMQKYKVLKTEGNYNNEIGLPLTILKIRAEHEIAVLEMGISNFGEMHRLSEIARPDYCVLTNIGQCHLENLGSREGILKAKTEIFDFMNEEGSVIVNGDDDMLASLSEVKGKKPVTFGIRKSQPVRLKDNKASRLDMNQFMDLFADHIVTHGLFGSSCDLHMDDCVIHADIPLPGEHMVYNALAAAGVGSLLGLTGDEIAAGIKSVQPVGGRNHIIRQDNYTVIDDCYNANPVSMKAAIELLAMADTNKVALLGDMGELGENEKEFHKEIGAYAAQKNINVLVCVGKLSSYMYDGASEAYQNSQNKYVVKNHSNDREENAPDGSNRYELLYFETRQELINALPSIIKKDDTILVKASHFMGFDQIIKALLN